MSKNLWAEAVNTVCVFTLNRSGTSSIDDKTPYELWFGKSYDVNFLKVFGSQCSVHIPKQKRRKLDVKSKIGIFVGYESNIKGYRIYYPQNNNVQIATDVVFIPQNVLQQNEQKGEKKI